MAAGGGNEPNLTPFIDLFSVLICFLLMTAAWLQLDVLQAKMESSTSKAPSEFDSEPPPSLKPDVKLIIGLALNEVQLSDNAIKMFIEYKNGELDTDKIKLTLAGWKKKYPDKNDIIVNSEAGVKYGRLISIYDLLVQSGWPEVGINPN